MTQNLEKRLDELETISRKLEPDAEARRDWIEKVYGYADRYLNGLDEAPAFFDRSDRGRGILGQPITDEGGRIEKIIALIDEHVDSVSLNPTSPRFLGYIPGGGLFPSALGDFLAAVSNRYAGNYFVAPGAVRIENELLRWMAGIIGYPKDAGGYLAVGGSMANLTAIVTARDHHEIEGSRVARAVVYTTEHTHHCIDKALNLAGLRSCVRRMVRVDNRYRMIPEQLQKTIESDRKQGLLPWLLVATAGTTNVGSIDPLEEVADVAEREDLWYHIDAAYGGFFVLCPETSDSLRGMSRADSVVMDPHKTLFLPYGTGALLVKERSRLLASHASGADYLQDTLAADEEISPADQSPEFTKHFRGLRLWLPLQLFGIGAFRAALSEKLLLARYFHRRLSESGSWEMGPEPELSVVIYRYLPENADPDTFNRRLVKEVMTDGRIFVSSTLVKNKFVLRMAAVSFRTHKKDIDTAVTVLNELASKLEREQR